MKIFYSQGREFSNPDALIALLDDNTQARLNKKVPRAKFQSLATHLLSLYAAAALGQKDLIPQRNDQGCPIFLHNKISSASSKVLSAFPSKFFLSCTHTDNMAAVAICEYPIGIDVEKINPWKKRISQRIFHALENELLEQSHQANLSDFVFTQIWTLRESYGKMLGTGILNLAPVSLLPKSEGVCCSDKACTAWTGLVEEFVLSAVWGEANAYTTPELIPISLEELESFFY